MMISYPAENTPIFTPLAQEVGLVCAAVYGVVWRYCQRKDENCHASLKTLGKEIKVDRATMMRNIETLCELGYLIDQTPGLRNVPHTYVLGKSVAECNSSKEAQADTTEDKTVVMRNSLQSETVAESNATVAHNNTSIESVAQNNSSKQTVAESNLKIEESLTESLLIPSSSSSAHAHKEDEEEAPLPILDNDFAKIAATYDRYFGEVDSAAGDLLGDYLDDKELATIAAEYGERPVDWVMSAIQEAGLNKAQKPATYLRATLRDWIKRRNRQPIPKHKNGATPPANKSSPPVNSDDYQRMVEQDKAQVFNPLAP